MEDRNIKDSVPLTAVEVNDAIVEDGFRNACSSGDMDVVKSIVTSCTDEEKKELLHKPSVTGTPLFDAIIAERLAVVSFLVDSGYDLELETDVNIFYPIFLRDQCTALCAACAFGNLKITNLLLEKGADVNHSSKYSSPLIYASEYNDTGLINLLLQYGADVHMVPQNLQTEAAALPLYQACLQGHQDTAEILLQSIEGSLSLEKKVCLLGLLGAQRISRHEDFESGKKYWRLALLELEKLQAKGMFEGQDLALKLQEMYIKESNESPVRCQPTQGCNTVGSSAMNTAIKLSDPLKHRHSVFKDMKLCTSVSELEGIASHHNLLNLQALLVLESIVGPSHTETTQQVSRAARDALENEDLSSACKLFLYMIESTEKRNQTKDASDYTSQLADLLLNIFSNSPEMLKRMADLVEILLAAMEFTQEGLCKIYNTYLNCHLSISSSSGEDTSASGLFESQSKQHSKVGLLAEMIETFMAFFRIYIDLDVSKEQWCIACKIVSDIVRSSSQCKDCLFNLESEMFRITTYGGLSASSTLYFYQEELFPNEKILDCLLHCGANVNRQDISGNTSLHYSMDCPNPNIDIVKRLLGYGGHIDVYNRYGLSPYTLMRHKEFASLQPFQYVTLKCLAARAIMSFSVPYKGQIPRSLEEFVPLHGLAKVPKSNIPGLKKFASADDVHIHNQGII